MLFESQCRQRKCKHYRGVVQPDGTEMSERVVCAAFPTGIPDEIAYGGNPHQTPFEGDQGIQYEGPQPYVERGATPWALSAADAEWLDAEFEALGARGFTADRERGFLRDADGERWRADPVDSAYDLMAALAERAAWRLARMGVADRQRVEVVRADGRRWRIRRWDSALVGTLLDAPVAELDDGRGQWLLAQQVADWMTAHHDAHGGRFGFRRDGSFSVLGREQAFRFWSDDRLAADYWPHRKWGSPEPVYNTLHREARPEAGPGVREAVERFSALPDTAVRGALADYAAQRFTTRGQERSFVDWALRRRDALAEDMRDFYGDRF